MDLSMNQTFIFDADGVIINGKLFSQHLADDLGITAEMTIPFFSTAFNECLEGKKDLRTEIEPFLSTWGWQGSVDDFLKYWFESERTIDTKLVALIQEFRKKGVKCFVATNQEHRRTNYMRKEMEFENFFDGVISSADLGVKKPNLVFFELLHEKTGRPDKTSTWFFDDTLKNVEAAIAFGVQARIYTTFSDFQDFIKKERIL
jgi:putative hydrolase of the HAD superfamily